MDSHRARCNTKRHLILGVIYDLLKIGAILFLRIRLAMASTNILHYFQEEWGCQVTLDLKWLNRLMKKVYNITCVFFSLQKRKRREKEDDAVSLCSLDLKVMKFFCTIVLARNTVLHPLNILVHSSLKV